MNQPQKEGVSIYYCGEEQCSAGHFFGPAVRPHYLIHIILSGKGIYKRGGQTYFLKKGDAFLISPMESTYYQADSEEPWHYIWAGFDGFEVEEMLDKTCFKKNQVFVCPPEGNIYSQVADQASFMMNTFRLPEHSPLTMLGHLYLLLGLMKGDREPLAEGRSDFYIRRAMEYMNNNYGYPIKIADTASFVGIDRTYLYRIFKQEEGISPKQYLIQLRLRSAAGMLSSPVYTVTEIAYSCGFKDAAAFCSQFKKNFAVTPTQFRINTIRESIV